MSDPEDLEQLTQETLEGDPAIDIRDRHHAQQIFKKLAENKTYTQIAEEMGVSRPTLYAYLRNSNVQQLMVAEMEEQRDQHMTRLDSMYESKNPQDKRFALKERGVMIRHMEDKVYPNLLQTRNLTITASVDTQKRDSHILTETLNRLSPDVSRLVTQTLQQVYKEHTQDTG